MLFAYLFSSKIDKNVFKKIVLCKKKIFALRLWDHFFFMTLGVGPRQAMERGNLASRLWERDRTRRWSAGRAKGASLVRSLVRSRDQSLTGIPTSPRHRHMFPTIFLGHPTKCHPMSAQILKYKEFLIWIALYIRNFPGVEKSCHS